MEEESHSHRLTDPSHEDPPAASSSPQRQFLEVRCHHNQLPAPQQIAIRANQTPQSDTPLPVPILPQDLIVEILTRLPVKSLVRFRCVSKSFKTLISNPQFIKSHLNKATNLSQRLILNSEYGLKSFSLYSLYNNPRTEAVKIDYCPFKDELWFDWFFGSCDGLLAMAIQEDVVVIWNPSTRDFLRLPSLGLQKRLFLGDAYFGFGYDAELDDYKVVALFRFWHEDVNGGSRLEFTVMVCTLRAQYWRRIEDFRYGIPDDDGKYVNGSICWPAKRASDSMWIVVSLDLVKETYKEVMQPDYGEVSDGKTLGVLDGRLCVMCDYPAVRADFWVMKDFGVRESWTKVASIPYLDESDVFQYPMPLCISDGEVLLEVCPSLMFESHSVIYIPKDGTVVYNPKDGTLRRPWIEGATFFCHLEIYIESLLSPNVEH